MTTKKKTTTAPLPPTDGSLTKQQFTQALADAGHTPEQLWEGEAGVKLRGPCFRSATDDYGMVVRVRRYYRGTFEEPPGSGRRKFFEARTKTLALQEARRIDRDLKDGLSSKEAARRFETVGDLIDAYLNEANHLDTWKSPRTKQAVQTFLEVWVRPVIGHLPCIEWDATGSQRILEQMDKCRLKTSYRDQGYTYLTALATFGRMRSHGFLPRHHDPLDEVARPGAGDDRYVDPHTLPEFSQVWALGDNLGLVVEQMWLRKLKRPSAARRERAAFERFRWSMLPKVAAGGGPRPNELLAARTGDFDLSHREQGLGLRIERQAVRGSSTQTAPPKHGSNRTTYLPDFLWDDVVRLVREVEARFGPNALLWPRMRDHTKMLDDSTLYTTYLNPAYELTAGFTYEDVPQWTVVEDKDGKGKPVLTTVPLLDDHGLQKTRRVWNYSLRHLRHLYGTTALAPQATGGWGQDIADVSACLGHKSAQTTWEYYIGRRRGSGARMASASRSLVAPTPEPATTRSPQPADGPPVGRHLRIVS